MEFWKCLIGSEGFFETEEFGELFPLAFGHSVELLVCFPCVFISVATVHVFALCDIYLKHP
jgi:hypothetical protein